MAHLQSERKRGEPGFRPHIRTGSRANPDFQTGVRNHEFFSTHRTIMRASSCRSPPAAIREANVETTTEATTTRVVIRRGEFHDPVALMAAEADVRRRDGVEHVAVGMADPLNLIIFRMRYGYELPAGEAPGPNDLVIAVRATSADG